MADVEWYQRGIQGLKGFMYSSLGAALDKYGINKLEQNRHGDHLQASPSIFVGACSVSERNAGQLIR